MKRNNIIIDVITTICALLFLCCLCCEGQTRQDVLKELHKQKVPHPTIVLAQAMLESGNFKSKFYKRTNNLFGLKENGRYAKYAHWKQSVEGYKKRVSYKYDRKKHRTYYDFLMDIGYAKDPKYINKLKSCVK